MDSFAYGATITLRGEFRNPTTKALESPTSTPVCTVTKPDGTVVTPTVITQGEGLFSAQVTPTISEQGVWKYRWDDPIGPGADPASAESSYFLVRD